MRLDRTTIMWAVLVLLILYAMQCNMGAKGNFPGREIMPDMAHSRAYDVYYPGPGSGSDIEKESGEQQVDAVFADGKVAREPVAGTVAQGYMPYPFEDTPEGYEESAALINPYAFACEDDLAQGKRLYTVNCAVCHGDNGQGKGKISATNGGPFAGVPNYMAAAYIQMEEGKMFHSIQYGKNNMGSYASQLNKEERWKVVAYVKQLQAEYAKSDQKLDATAALAYVRGTVGETMPRTSLGVAPPDCEAKAAALAKQKATIDARLKMAKEQESHGHGDHGAHGDAHGADHHATEHKAQAHANDTTTKSQSALGAVAAATAALTQKAVTTFSDVVKTGKKFAKGDQIVLENVTFNTASADIKPSSFAELDNVIKILKENANMKLLVTGHTDNEGDAQKNKTLSDSRAKSVFTYLVANGIDKTRLQHKGFGADTPVASNDTPEGRAKNRRIEFEVQ